MACAIGRAVAFDAAPLAYASAGAGPVPRRNDSWAAEEGPRWISIVAFFRGLRGALMGVRGTSRRQGA